MGSYFLCFKLCPYFPLIPKSRPDVLFAADSDEIRQGVECVKEKSDNLSRQLFKCRQEITGVCFLRLCFDDLPV